MPCAMLWPDKPIRQTQVGSKVLGDTHHVVARKELLQEFSFLVHHSFYDEFIVAGDIEEGAAGTRVRQLNQRVIT